jgi:putative hemolysin
MLEALDSAGHLHDEPAPPVRFSYSRKEHGVLQRLVIRAIERFTGQPRLERLYRAWAENPHPHENIFSAGLSLLNLRLDMDEAALAKIPRRGPVLFVANHPFGVVDGLTMGHLATRARPDTLIMTHSLLCQPPEARDYLLPVDFGGTDEAQATTMATRRRAVNWLNLGHSLVVFPSGGMATSQRPFRGPAVEYAWHPFVGKLARLPGVTVVPVYFHGQNSRAFQILSHTNYALRIALLFRESVRRMGTSLKVSMGQPIASDALARLPDRNAVIAELRHATLALGGAEAPSPELEFKFPKHVYSE